MFSCPSRWVLSVCLILALGRASHGQPPKTVVKGDRVSADRHGDPLPEGAVARLGTMRWRLPGATRTLGFTFDGSGLIVRPEFKSDDALHVLALTTGKVSLRLVAKDLSGANFSLASRERLLAVSSDGKVALWEMPAGRLLREINTRQSHVLVALSPDGKTLATAASGYHQVGRTYPIQLWDVASGRAVGSLEGHTTPIMALVFSADGKRLLSSSPEHRWGKAGGGVEIFPGAVRVWDVAARKQMRQYPNESYSLVFAPDGRTWASLGKDNRIYLVETATGKELGRIATEALDYKFTPDGKALATAGRGQTICLWDAATGQELRRLEGPLGDGLPALFFAPNGKTVACINQPNWSIPGGTVRLWDMNTGKEIRSYAVHQEAVTCAAYTPDGKTVASGGKDGSLFLWDAATGKPLHRLASHKEAVLAVAFAPDGRWLASGGRDRVVCLWRVADGKLEQQFTGVGSDILALTFSADGRSLWACGMKGKLRGWDVVGGEVLGQTDLPANSLHTAAFSADGSLFAYVPGIQGGFFGETSKIHVCRTSSGKELLSLNLREMVVRRKDDLGVVAVHCWAVAFSADGRLLATSESLQTQGLRTILSNHTIRIWELATGKEVQQLVGLAVPTKHLAFAPNGRLMAYSHGRMMGWGHGDERVFVLRDLTVGSVLQQKVNDKGEVMCLHSGVTLRPLDGPSGGVSCVLFAPDSKTVLTGGADGTLLTWTTAAFAPAKRERPAEVSDKQMQALWEQMAGGDAALAHLAVSQLIHAPDRTVRFLKEHLKPAQGVDARRVAKLIATLEAKSFAARQKAFNELATYADQVEEALRKALPRQRALETQRRLQQLLYRLDKRVLSPEHLRTLRALTLLERIGTPEARQVLEQLARAAPEARLAREAQASLERLRSRQPGGSP